jgi:hypothetical protein
MSFSYVIMYVSLLKVFCLKGVQKEMTGAGDGLF